MVVLALVWVLYRYLLELRMRLPGEFRFPIDAPTDRHRRVTKTHHADGRTQQSRKIFLDVLSCWASAAAEELSHAVKLPDRENPTEKNKMSRKRCRRRKRNGTVARSTITPAYDIILDFI